MKRKTKLTITELKDYMLDASDKMVNATKTDDWEEVVKNHFKAAAIAELLIDNDMMPDYLLEESEQLINMLPQAFLIIAMRMGNR